MVIRKMENYKIFSTIKWNCTLTHTVPGTSKGIMQIMKLSKCTHKISTKSVFRIKCAKQIVLCFSNKVESVSLI